MNQNRRRQPGMGVMLLFYQLFGVIGIDKIPPVTLGAIALQVGIFLRLFKLPWTDPSQVCISVYNVWKRKEISRLLYGALEHGDDWHLYYNMLSFALKGQSLEKRYGSVKYFCILSCFTVLTSTVLVTLSALADKYLDYDARACSIGFSGVIFALKVLTTHHDRNYMQSIMGIPIVVPAKYAVWVELIMIQLMVPNVSFFGHLAGILVGLAYVKGPLKYIMDVIFPTIARSFSTSQPRFTQGTYRSGYTSENFNEFVPPGMSEEEQLRRAMDESARQSYHYGTNSVPPYPDHHQPRNSPPYPDHHRSRNSPPPPPGFIFDDDIHPPPAPGFSPDIDEIRNRRNARFTSY